ncbi:hypothetical protein [Ferrimonas marina]|uniref:Maltose operon substrate-binding protein (MalM) n=1 Tax=Ferrimonas marina TaxID=299255 RepID=A0A1M5ZFV3_9GAMM|nr:hypothetical protein [Ferrimonas marina]SHI22763.1 hypothetical protein SAMN02745129_0185 [Ferrimonas marina]
MKYNALLAAALIVLTGCATPPEQQRHALMAEPVCCSHFAELTMLQPDFTKALKLEMGPGLSVYEYEGERSYAVAMELPDMTDHYFMLKSYVRGLHKRQYFDPVLFELNADRQLIHAYSLQMKHFGGSLMERSHLRAAVTPLPEARYLVIMSLETGESAPEATRYTPNQSLFHGAGRVPIVTHHSNAKKPSSALNKAPKGRLMIERRPIDLRASYMF